jgi:glycine/D-amino acid oxidase-like deaminating enzyme
MNYSFWEKYFIESPADVTIIGSGIVGLSTAISIKESRPDISVKIIERGAMPYGASTKNAGFSCFGSVSELLDDIKNMGEEACMDVVRMRWRGLQKLKKRVGEQSLEYDHCGGSELFRSKDILLKESCLDGLEKCNRLIKTHLGLDDCYSLKKNNTLKGFDEVSILNQYEGTINPVSMMNELIRKAINIGVIIMNGIHITEIDQVKKVLNAYNNLKINYENLIVCTNGFAARLIPDLPVMPARNQVLMTSPLKNLHLSSGYHLDKGYIYFRQYNGRILLGGGRNMDEKTETTDEFGNTELIQHYLKDILETIYPGASGQIEHWWSGILGVGNSKYPIVQWLDDHLLVGVRLGGMGVAIGSHLGEKLANEMLTNMDKNNRS